MGSACHQHPHAPGQLTVPGLPRRIKSGSELVRTWNRSTYRVVVMEKGFAWEGRTYSSLSEIAFAITGTKWNGPRFFGLRSRLAKSVDGSDKHAR